MPSRKKKIKEEEQPQFPDSINIMDLPVNSKLKPPEILDVSHNPRTGKFTLKFSIPGNDKLFNVYLRTNGAKKDMLCQVHPGKYSFKGTANVDDNLFEVFYTTAGSRSSTVFSFLHKG